MLHIFDIYIILQTILFKTISPNFIDVCFKSVFHKKINVNFKVNADLPFVPDLIHVDIHSKKEIIDASGKIFDVEHLLLKKAEFQCSDGLEYKVSFRNEPLIVLNITVFWGDERYIIEKFQMIVLKDFVVGVYTLQGLLEHMMLEVSLDQEYSVPRDAISLNFYIPNIHWSTEVRPLLPDERYCIAFLTLEFRKIMALTADSFDHNLPLEYYIFTATAKGFGEDTCAQKSYLVKIYPCRLPIKDQDIAEIYVSKFNIIIDFELSEKAQRHVHRVRYANHHFKFKRVTNYPTFYFLSLKFNSKKNVKEAFYGRVGILLLHLDEKFLRCDLELPDVLERYKRTFAREIVSKNDLIYERLHFIDTSTEENGVFAIRLATESEIAKCRPIFR